MYVHRIFIWHAIWDWAWQAKRKRGRGTETRRENLWCPQEGVGNEIGGGINSIMELGKIRTTYLNHIHITKEIVVRGKEVSNHRWIRAPPS